MSECDAGMLKEQMQKRVGLLREEECSPHMTAMMGNSLRWRNKP